MTMAEEIVRTLSEYLVASIGRQFKYLFCYSSIIDNLKDEVNELQLMRDGEQMCVEEARNNAHAINPLVGDWLSKVEEISTRSEMIFKETVNVQKGCFNGWCPNLNSSYFLARRATKKIKEVVKLKGEAPQNIRGEQDIANAKLQVVVDKSISLLNGVLLGDGAEDISHVALNVRDMLLNARNAMAPEKAQEDRRKKMHDSNATPSSATKPSTKEKGEAAMRKRMKN